MAKQKKKISRSERVRRRREKALGRACSDLLSTSIERVEFPGGRTRESYRLHLADGRSVIGTQRDKPHRARAECRVLKSLNRGGAPVPAFLGWDRDRILFQEALSGERLTRVIQEAPKKDRRATLRSALHGLCVSQEAARKSGVGRHLARLGTDERWLAGLIRRPGVIGEYLDVPAPSLDEKALCSALKPRSLEFVKWDARPGNAVVDDAGVVRWFDWEHAGLRCGLDDIAWLLGDEYVIDDVEGEAELLNEFVPRFAPGRDPEEAGRYLAAYGTFHMTIRLGLILKYKSDKWWGFDHCIDNDKVGIMLHCARNLCQRAARWSARHPDTVPLSAWFQQVQDRLATI